MCVCVCVCVYIHTYVYIHTHIHTYMTHVKTKEKNIYCVHVNILAYYTGAHKPKIHCNRSVLTL